MLFYQALTLFAEGLILWVVLGAVDAAIALAGVGYAILRLAKSCPAADATAGASVLLLLSIAFPRRHAGRFT